MRSFIAFGVGVAAIGISALAATGAQAADLPYRVQKTRHSYERPVPRVYYQPVRPAAVCRIAALKSRYGFPREQSRVMSCQGFY